MQQRDEVQFLVRQGRDGLYRYGIYLGKNCELYSTKVAGYTTATEAATVARRIVHRIRFGSPSVATDEKVWYSWEWPGS